MTAAAKFSWRFFRDCRSAIVADFSANSVHSQPSIRPAAAYILAVDSKPVGLLDSSRLIGLLLLPGYCRRLHKKRHGRLFRAAKFCNAFNLFREEEIP